MLKKAILSTMFFMCCLTLPVLAHATVWQIGTTVNTGGGNIVVRNITQTYGSTVYRSYTTHANVPIAVNANTGYQVSVVKVNGVAQTLPIASGTTYQMNIANGLNQTFAASFSAQQLAVSSTSGAGGYVTPAGSWTYYYGTQTTPIVFKFIPNTGNNVITINGLPSSGYTLTDASTGAAVTLPGAINQTVKLTITNLTTPLTLSGVFLSVIANAGAPQYVLPSMFVMLDGSATTPSSAALVWAITGGPASVTLSDPTAVQPTFTAPATLGTYYFQLTATYNGATSTANTRVIVATSAAVVARSQCANCHISAGIGVSDNVFGNWSSSKHEANMVMCPNCHVGANSGAHPGTWPVVDNVCKNCHYDSTGTVPNHQLFVIGTNSCITSMCHSPHSTTVGGYTHSPPHFNNVTTGAYPASFLTSRAACTDCHADTPANQTNRLQWETSSHANINGPAFVQQDFKTLDGCVRCHTTTGFVNYTTGKVTAAWGDASDKTKELITCRACHVDMPNGIPRTIAPIAPYPDDTFTTPDLGRSNICVRCHVGTKNGKSITAQLSALADFTNLAFIDPHYAATAGNLFGQAGYHFPGRTYNGAATHSTIAATDASGANEGPCVTCHKNPLNGHDYAPIGVIALCGSCHGTSFDSTTLGNDKTAFQNAMQVLRAQLAAKGFVYTGAPPFFTNTNWGSGQDGANTMGAAFNFVLLTTEPGIYAHNPIYAQQLVLDSIDYLDNGQIDGSITNLALPTLVSSGAITQATATNATTYQAKNFCTSCHGYTAASGIPMATNGHPTHLTATYGPAAVLGSDFGACQTCHVYGASTHLNGTVDLINGTGSACQNCHPAGPPPWNLGARYACTDCHSPTPSVLPNGVAAPYKENFDITGHGQFANSNQCTNCHDQNSAHISGTLGTYKRLLLPDDNNLCASCHNDPTVVTTSTSQNMQTHIKPDGTQLLCVNCHDTHGTTNLNMLRTTINGTTITVTDLNNGLVDQVTNYGFCQVCHTATAHYRAGVPETGHFTSGCLGCHTHNAFGGAFRPVGGSCDACHGYPPAPRVVTSSVAFGTMNNWSSARFEDYSGGGGAHLVAAHINPNARPSEGWANCTICHNGGRTGSTPYHKMQTPPGKHISNVHVEVDPQNRFSNSFTIYTGARQVNPPAMNATGSCFNISCHFQPSPRWSIER
ncbi:MAG TPA: cytochrome C [Geobacteraceae bacterium]